ncbi:hypothetical protein [Endozoicomonas sp. ONNA2]|uniref:hypothetical protein n=1 Tax=Endozoicomonas sp. ONNA2 TaxID=2828741 RepID=UPI0021496BC7|nr:hypothetical protein [Endozoicomonas sp. ONNA2]
MIQQPGLNPAGIATHRQPVTTPSTEPQGQWQGLVIRTARELARSVNPFYAPPNARAPLSNTAGSAVAIDLPGLDDQSSHCLQFTSLAGRAIAAYANLPPEINQALGYLANLVGAGRFASELRTHTAPAGLEPGAHGANALAEPPQNAEGETRKASQKPRQLTDKSTTSRLLVNQLPNASLALGALVGLCAVGASSAADSDTTNWIPVPNAEKLGEICLDEDSCSKKYQLTDHIDGSQLTQSIGDFTLPFTGELDGGNHHICGLRDCLIKHLSGKDDKGLLFNLHFKNAEINSSTPAGVVACGMTDNARISNITVEGAVLANNGSTASTAIGVGYVSGGTVTGITAKNCHVTTYGRGSNAGIAVGKLFSGTIDGTKAASCTVTTKGKDALDALNRSTEGSNAGIGAGFIGKEGTVNGTTAVNCKVTTHYSYANAGIGAGTNKGTVRNTKAVNCHVKTGGEKAHAGIGAGFINKGTVDSTTAVKCTVTTSGRDSYAGIGAGRSLGKNTVNNTNAFHTNVTSSSKAHIKGGDKKVICDVRIRSPKYNAHLNATSPDCRDYSHKGICAAIAPDLVTPDCQPVEYVTGSSNCANVPLTSTAATTSVTVPSTNMPLSDLGTAITPLTTPASSNMPLSDMGTAITPLTTPASSNIPLSGQGPDTITMPASTPTPLSSNLPFSGSGIATPAPLTSPSLGATAITGITLGAAAFFVVAGLVGVCAYRCYRQRASTAADDSNELMPRHTNSQTRTARPLPDPPELHYENNYELLVSPARQENAAKAGSYSMVNIGKEPDPHRL